MRRAALLLVGLAALAGCRELKKDGTVCPEYRDLRCLAGTSCSMDRSRGCKVCQCNPMDEMTTTQPDDPSNDPSIPPPTE